MTDFHAFGVLQYTVIYYYLDNENCYDNDNSKCTDHDNLFILIIAQPYIVLKYFVHHSTDFIGTILSEMRCLLDDKKR